MCIRRETWEKARQSLAFSRVSKPHTHITHMLRQCTSIVYILFIIQLNKIKQSFCTMPWISHFLGKLKVRILSSHGIVKPL